MKVIVALFIVSYNTALIAQPTLNARDQKRKAEFLASLEAEKQFDLSLAKAEKAFQDGDYPTARMAYAEAAEWDATQTQWLNSKINDLDILMAKNAARAVDSMEAAQIISPSALPLNEATPMVPTLLKADKISPTETSPAPVRTEVTQEEVTTTEVAPVQLPAPPKSKPTATKQAVAPAPSTTDTTDALDFSKFNKGLTEEFFEMENHKVHRIVVIDGADAMVFKKVTHSWGGEFFFKDGISVGRRLWTEEIEMYRNKWK